MAKMHTRKKGKSSSTKPTNATKPTWVTMTQAEIEDLVVEIAKTGKTEAQIGQILRDQYAIPSVKLLTGKTISQVLKSRKAASEYPSDLIDLIRRAMNIRKHLGKNTRDDSNKKKLTDVESKVKRLVRYYRGKKLPAGWKYDPEKAALLVK